LKFFIDKEKQLLTEMQERTFNLQKSPAMRYTKKIEKKEQELYFKEFQ